MWLSVLMIVGGIACVLWGAGRLTDGAVAIAGRMGVSQIVIGLTVVAMGTSMPEFCVSMVSAVKGTTAMAVGNVIGSNIFNSMLIVGTAAMLTPITILSSTVRKDIPFAVIASAVLVLLCVDGDVSRWDALVLLVMFVMFMYTTLRSALADRKGGKDEADEKQKDIPPMWKAALMMIVGLTCLVAGSEVFVRGASAVATAWGISDAVVGLTVVAMGTSMPELATTVVSARKGNSGIAIGNVLGSNVFNILLVLGASGVVTPLSTFALTWVDLVVLLLSAALLWLWTYTGKRDRVDRGEAALMLLLFFGYYTWLFIKL